MGWDYAGRAARVLEGLGRLGMTQALVSDPVSVDWLTGVRVEPGERFLGLVLRAGQAPTLVVNELFLPAGEGAGEGSDTAGEEPGSAAEAGVASGAAFKAGSASGQDDAAGAHDATRDQRDVTRGLPVAPGVRVVGYSDDDDPLAAVAAALDPDAALGVDKDLPARFLLGLRDARAASSFALASSAVDGARAVKDAAEQAAMRVSSAVADAVMARLPGELREGVTERQLAHRVEELFGEYGAKPYVPFVCIVAFGPHAAEPHHLPDDTLLRPGDAVLFDMGAVLDGYCSDMTRMFTFGGEASDEQRRIYDVVRRANEAAEARATLGGAYFDELDAVARGVIEEAGYGPYFTHRLGHQIGMGGHEPGNLGAGHHELVFPGACFSIEPGIYLPGGPGARLEDLLIMHEDGAEVINHFTHELLAVG